MFNVCKRSATSLSRYGARFTARLTSLTPPTPSTTYPLRQCTHRPLVEARWLHISSILKNDQNVNASTPQRRDVKTFRELAEFDMVHPNVINEITNKMKHENLTEVQVATINEGLQGCDIIAQARTGTGKTLGFLIPTIQNIIRKNPELATRKKYSRARASDIRAIIISPTRELAEQIAVEAEKLCYNTDLIVQVAVGGNSKRQMLMKTQREGCHLLVATPGRLMDLLTDPRSGVSAPNLTTLVLDEADRLLDDGFSKDIEDIVRVLPDRSAVDRQTLLFSATVPKEVMGLVRRTLKPDFHFVQTVKEGEPATHEKVPQNIIITPGIENWLPSLVELGRKSISESLPQLANSEESKAKPFKAIVYFTSTAQVQLAYEVVKNLKFPNGKFGTPHPLYPAQLFIINGQMTQEGRTRAADRFRRCTYGILFSTDVTARGMDFPGVSHVLQFGLPPNREQYIHRIGRTGRGDKTGDGFIFVDVASLPDAKRMLRGLPITENKSIKASQVDMSKEAQLPEDVAETISLVTEASKLSSPRSKDAAYKSALNCVKTAPQAMSLGRWTKYAWGYEQPPAIGTALASKLGLSRLPGINVGRPTIYDDEPASGSGRSNFGARSGGFGDRSSSFGGRSGGFGNRSGGFRERTGGFGNRSGGFGERSGGFGERSGGFGERSGGFADRSSSFGGRSGGFGDRSSSLGGRSGGFGDRTSSLGGRSGGFGDRTSSLGGRSGGFGDRSSSFGGRSGGFGDRSSSLGGRSGGYGDRSGGRGGFGDRGDRGGFGNRGSSFGGQSSDRNGFGARSDNRSSFGGRGGFGDRGGDIGGFGNRGRSTR